MFKNCSNLLEVPELKSIYLAEGCYASMFEGCSSITKTKLLPAITLASSCYKEMFKNCKDLRNLAILPATVLDESCYASMFEGCSSLKVSNKAYGDIFFRSPEELPKDSVKDMFSETAGEYSIDPVIVEKYYVYN